MQREEFSRYERLKVILEDWANWSKGYRQNIGWPSRAVGFESGYVSSTFDDMMDGVEKRINECVDSAINDLDAGHKAAIHRCYGISSVFRFPRGNYETLLLESHELLIVSINRKGVAI